MIHSECVEFEHGKGIATHQLAYLSGEYRFTRTPGPIQYDDDGFTSSTKNIAQALTEFLVAEYIIGFIKPLAWNNVGFVNEEFVAAFYHC